MFGVFAAIGFALFAGLGSFFGGDKISQVMIWGTVSENVISPVLNELEDSFKGFAVVSYEEKDARSYEETFVNALASGVGPDLLLLPHTLLAKHEDKIITIPYESYGERAFRETFIEEGELFLLPEGVAGVPFLIDPLVMYWNRNIFSSAGVVNPPAFWDELFTLSSDITKRDEGTNIIRSTVALGEFININHAKEIISALIIQAGNPIVVRNGDRLSSVLNRRNESTSLPSESALRFYTEFSNPVKSVYSWNRSLPLDRRAFIAEDLALYFGFASELLELRQANPNLNFDVAPLPQSRESRFKKTFGNMTAFVILRSAQNPDAAFSVAAVLAGNTALAQVSDLTGLPPVRRDLLAQKPVDAFEVIFYDSALMSRAWLDPDSEETDRIFKDMIEGVTSGRFRLSNAVSRAQDELEILFR